MIYYWQQEAACQKGSLSLRDSLTKDRAGDRHEEVEPPIQLNEEADCMHEKRETLYYAAIIHKHLDQAVDALPYWKEAAYQRKALTEWVPSFKNCGDSLRYGIDQLEYWREGSRDLHPIANRLMKELQRKHAELRKIVIKRSLTPYLLATLNQGGHTLISIYRRGTTIQ